MDKKSLLVIQSAIYNAIEAIEQLAYENYPYTDCYDPDIRKMMYEMNRMSLKITEKIEKRGGRNEKGL